MASLISISQSSFGAGELSPGLRGRTDLEKYRSGAALLRNFFVQPYGGAATRPGTAIVGRCLQPYGTPPRNIPFIFSTVQAYMLEFGQGYMRVIMDGGYVLEPANPILGITQANPGSFHMTAHGFIVGDWVYVAGALGMTQVNTTPGYLWRVESVPDANHVTLQNIDLSSLNTMTYPAYTGGGLMARVFTLATPYAAADLPLLKYTQSADVMTLTHPSYAPRDLTRTGHAAWTLTPITFTASINPPTGVAGTAFTPGGGATDLDYYYVVTSVKDTPFEESIASSIGVIGNDGLDQSTGIQNLVEWTAPVAGATPDRYYIYRAPALYETNTDVPASFGYIGQSLTAQFTDVNFQPDFSRQPPVHRDPFAGVNYPACAAYFQSRKCFAASGSFPETIWATQTGNFKNMDIHSPSQADDALTLTLVSQQVNAIRHLVSLNALLVLTTDGAWRVSGDGDNAVLTPTSVQAQPQAYNGCSQVRPLTVGNDILYVQARGSKVRSLAYDFYVNLFTGTDLSILSNHLFYSFNIREWCYAEEPYYQILGVRSDGQMLSFTYLKEQQVYAWTHYDTPGDSGTDAYVSCASIPEGDVNAVYTIVARTIPGINGGAPVYYQERFDDRNFYVDGVADVRRAWCVDCGVRYEGAPTSTITGLRYLEGCEVSILADGNVISPRTVVNGTITLDAPASIVCVGLPYTCELQTLRLDLGQPSIQGKRKKIARLTLIVQDSRGLKVGPMRELVNGNIEPGPLTPIKERANLPYGDPIPLKTGMQTLMIEPQWQMDGAVFISQTNPLPSTILSCIPLFSVGDDGG